MSTQTLTLPSAAPAGTGVINTTVLALVEPLSHLACALSDSDRARVAAQVRRRRTVLASELIEEVFGAANHRPDVVEHLMYQSEQEVIDALRDLLNDLNQFLEVRRGYRRRHAPDRSRPVTPRRTQRDRNRAARYAYRGDGRQRP
jgi:hypothetical protein